MKKLKAESSGYYKGGWGTFIVAFEDKKVAGLSTALNELGPSLRKPKASSKGVVALKEHEGGPQTSQPSSQSVNLTEKFDGPHPIEKIKHFVEVGFLIDSVDFRLTSTLDEETYDSNLKKYLFEF